MVIYRTEVYYAIYSTVVFSFRCVSRRGKASDYCPGQAVHPINTEFCGSIPHISVEVVSDLVRLHS